MIKICKYCELEFQSKTNKQLFCSKLCFNKYNFPSYMKPRICEICKSEFVSSSSKRKYCSDECIKKSYKKIEPKVKFCKECGKEFKSESNRQEYCTKECLSKKYLRLEVKVKICKGCGKEFQPESNKYQYCSEGCRPKKDYHKVITPKKIKTKRCVICENEFQPKHGRQIYCSDNCLNNKRRTPDIRKCFTCEKEFSSTNGTLYCSYECRDDEPNKVIKTSDTIVPKKVKAIFQKKPKTNICKYCEQEFEVKTHNQLFCSGECYVSYYRNKSTIRICECGCEEKFRNPNPEVKYKSGHGLKPKVCDLCLDELVTDGIQLGECTICLKCQTNINNMSTQSLSNKTDARAVDLL